MIDVQTVVGGGSFATVSCGIVRNPPCVPVCRVLEVAVKQAHDPCDVKTILTMRNEAQILRRVGKHQNIVFLMDEQTTHLSMAPVLVFEFCAGGTLADDLSRPQPNGVIFATLVQMHNALSFLAKHNIVHRDIKPANILVASKSSNLWLKLADFGMASLCDGTTNNLSGTPNYMAPECWPCVFNTKCLVPAMDVWSLGAVLFHLATGAVPFQLRRRRDFPTLFNTCPVADLSRAPSTLPGPVKSLISKMLCVDHTLRISCGQIPADAGFVLATTAPVEAAPTTATNVRYELADALFCDSDDDAGSGAEAAFAHLPLQITDHTQQHSLAFRTLTLEQQLEVAQGLQMFVCATYRRCDATPLDATIDSFNEYQPVLSRAEQLWTALAFVRTCCLQSDALTRTNVAAFVIFAVRAHVAEIQASTSLFLHRDRVSRKLVWAVRNIDHLLHFLLMCVQQWNLQHRPLSNVHPLAHLRAFVNQHKAHALAYTHFSNTAKKNITALSRVIFQDSSF